MSAHRHIILRIPHLAERARDRLTDQMKSVDSRHSLIDYLSDKGFDLIGHSNSDQVKVANSALNEGEWVHLIGPNGYHFH